MASTNQQRHLLKWRLKVPSLLHVFVLLIFSNNFLHMRNATACASCLVSTCGSEFVIKWNYSKSSNSPNEHLVLSCRQFHVWQLIKNILVWKILIFVYTTFLMSCYICVAGAIKAFQNFNTADSKPTSDCVFFLNLSLECSTLAFKNSGRLLGLKKKKKLPIWESQFLGWITF